jgi:hypothetical protein
VPPCFGNVCVLTALAHGRYTLRLEHQGGKEGMKWREPTEGDVYTLWVEYLTDESPGTEGDPDDMETLTLDLAMVVVPPPPPDGRASLEEAESRHGVVYDPDTESLSLVQERMGVFRAGQTQVGPGPRRPPLSRAGHGRRSSPRGSSRSSAWPTAWGTRPRGRQR